MLSILFYDFFTVLPNSRVPAARKTARKPAVPRVTNTGLARIIMGPMVLYGCCQKEPRVLAVSYTHLDVYKRQPDRRIP